MATKDNRKRRVVQRTDDGWYVIAPGLALWISTVDIVDDELGVELGIDVSYDAETGRLEATELRIRRRRDARPMAEVLRQLPLTSLTEKALRDAMEAGAWVETKPGSWRNIGTESLEGEDEIDYVARLYRLGSACGYRPTQFVQAILGLAESTAAGKVVLARKLGKLPKTESGKARA